jgi:hypothetical protein
MPPLRKRALEKRSKPKLNAHVWAWLDTGAKRPYHQGLVDNDTAWQIFVLEGLPVHYWRPPDGPPNRVERFWAAVREAVEMGELEVTEDAVHNCFDPPLVNLESLFGGEAA